MTTLDWIMIGTWAFVFIATLIIEIETTNLTTIWFSISALLTLILTATIPFVLNSPLLQVGIFVIVSGILLFVTLPIMKKVKRTDFIPTNTDKIIGKLAIVTKDVYPNEIGEVKVDNTLWRAIGASEEIFMKGEKVHINSISGIKVIISKIDNNDANIKVL